jgi:hypothetical protein
LLGANIALICPYFDISKEDVLFDMSEKTNKSERRDIIKTWLAGQHSCTLVIPKDFAKEYGLDQPAHVIVEGRPEGILIRKLEV